MSHRDRVTGVMSDADALLWTIGRDPVLRAPIVAVVILDTEPDWDEVERRIGELTRVVPRLRCRAVPRHVALGNPRWEDDGGFDLSQHLHRVAAPSPATVRTVLDLAQAMGSTAFDPELPLWETTLVEGVGGGRAAVIMKVHHAVVDGVGGIGVMLHVLDRERRPPPAATHAAKGNGRAGRGGGHRGAAPPPDGALGLPAAAARLIAGSTRAVAHAVARTVQDPVGSVETARATAGSVVRLLAPATSPLSPLMQGRGMVHNYDAFSYEGDEFHRAAAACGATMNDVFVAGILGGLARYHHRHGVDAGAVRALMPINIRAADDAEGGNHFVPARLVLQLDIEDPVSRTRHVDETTATWKHDPALGLTDLLAGLLNRLPPAATTAVFGSMLKGDDFVASNVPGPPFETYLAGARVEDLFAFAPTSGAAVNVALLTPADRACIGVNVDTTAVPDAAMLVACLREGFGEVLATGGPPPPGPADAVEEDGEVTSAGKVTSAEEVTSPGGAAS